jgi:rhodanese-related sulfurtransferase
VANFLTSALDFSNVSNVAGGIDAYAAVDASVPRY